MTQPTNDPTHDGTDDRTDDPAAAALPHVAVRVSVTSGGTTTRSDLVLQGSRGTLRTEGRDAVGFASGALWPTVRGLLPTLPHVVADPAVSRPEDRRPAGDELLVTCGHAITVVVAARMPGEEDAVAVRTWLVSPDTLHGVVAGPDGSTAVLTEGSGALAATLEWDVAGAMDHLVGRLRERGAA
ncbi:hypothetical protein RDV89_16845 [Nocardioides zeae]|uniref:Uncharacterized protein n=1 Tax=Nocardioides imazamoxiresistens TaxID=3231893 RepID=A0ABU3PZR6_9ACTN|nr:hypothetical protein [Nocardioides zeae]MDT9594757.1 hypothetical protein [Nocardioides zeae]